MLKIFLVCIWIFLITSSVLVSQPLDFFREKIEIEVGGNYCKLIGKYFFSNSSKQPLIQTFYYPFIVNDSLPYPDKISVVNNRDNSLIKFKKQKKGIILQAKISSNDTLIYTVEYSQKTPYSMFEYILTTTQEWHKPIVEAEYVVKIPKKFKLDFNSLGYDNKSIQKRFTVYNLQKKYFMPDKNFKIKWGTK
ncbi:MAG: hypothetical protein NTX22_05270 [Ignavibacteriales bacterium]|nr:hypothetical protein [Ignavibacteriales bacterium]